MGGATIRCTRSELVTVAALPVPTSWVAARLIGVVDPYGARWSRPITSAADAALRACLLRTLDTPAVRGCAAIALPVARRPRRSEPPVSTIRGAGQDA